MKKIILLLFFAGTISIIFAQTYNIEGNAFLENETNHSEITITLNRTAPSTITYTLTTNSSGIFSDNIEEGIYNISYSKNGYISQNLTNIYVYNDIQLESTTLLLIGISGNLSGTLESGTYSIGDDITIPSGETLTIEPGTTLKFRENAKLIVDGLLIANGTLTDSIIFTNKDTEERWGGIRLNSHLSNQISYSRIEYSNEGGISISSGDATIHHSVIRNNDNDDGGGGIKIDNSNVDLYNLSIYNNTASSGAGISALVNYETINISNCMIFNNISEYNGGGLLISSFDCETPPSIINCIFCNNMSGGTLTGNIHEYHCSANYVNNIIYNNNKYGIYFSEDNIGNSYIAYNNIYGNTSGNFYNTPNLIGEIMTTNANGHQCDAYHNIHENPLFENTSNNNFHLLENSPCIDAGLNSYSIYEFDFDNNNRIWSPQQNENQVIDIGVYEFGATSKINHENDISNINIYPNPAKEIIFINNNDTRINKVIITDILGKIISENQYSDQNKAINISDLKNGVYIVIIKMDNMTYRKKIVKE